MQHKPNELTVKSLEPVLLEAVCSLPEPIPSFYKNICPIGHVGHAGPDRKIILMIKLK